jgi:hypothetical protein
MPVRRGQGPLLTLACVSRLFAGYILRAGMPQVICAAQVPYRRHDERLEPLCSGLSFMPLGVGPAFVRTRAGLSLILRLAPSI